MRTMPYELGSSVEVISVADAQRMQRMVSTDTVMPAARESMLGRYEEPAEELESSESDEAVDDELP